MFVETRPATVGELSLVHRREYIEAIRLVSASGNPTLLDPDTVCTASSYDVALLAAGAAIQAVELICACFIWVYFRVYLAALRLPQGAPDLPKIPKNPLGSPR